MTYAPVGSGDVHALDEDDGSRIDPDENGFVTLGVDTYLFPLDGSDADLVSVQILTDATIAGVFTIETCNFPKFKGSMGGGVVDVSDHDTTGSKWVKQNPPSAYVPTVGTGWTVSALTLTKTAGVGSAEIDLGNFGGRRVRLNAAITTGGKVRISRYGKKH